MSMEREQIFDVLAAHNVQKVTLEFSGGGDEGNVDDITAFIVEGEVLGEYELAEALKDWNDEEYDVEDMATAMEDIVSDRMGAFDGPGVCGTLDWVVSTRKLVLNYAIEEYVDQDQEEF